MDIWEFWDKVRPWLAHSFGPHWSAILFTALVAFSIPFILHHYLYRVATSDVLPTFLLIGPSGAGKTSLITMLETGKPAATHTSQTPLEMTIALPTTTTAASARYRAEADPSRLKARRFRLIDLPGHGKLRHHTAETIAKTPLKDLKGVVFLVDAANLSASAEGGGLTEAAEYLHDVLLALQKLHTNAKTSKNTGIIPVLVGANKMDLFTALPEGLVKNVLEKEIGKVRETRAKGLRDSAVGIGEDALAQDDEDREWLGEGGEGPFEFTQLEECNVYVEVRGGNVKGAEGADVSRWWAWFGDQL